MVDDTYSVALAELDGIANAAMTESEREMRAQPVTAGLSISEICSALAGKGLGWNHRKAAAYGVSVEDWLRALDVAGLENCGSLGALIGVIHRAESAAAMLRAGYKPAHDDAGHLSWSH